MSMTGKKIRIWANGCFDVYHFGHANFLRQAKDVGGYLIAGLHGDADITNNKAAPVLDDDERAQIIAAVEWVDEIRTHIPYGNVLDTLERYACYYCAHGDDIAYNALGEDIYAVCKSLGRFKECKRTEGISTTLIIDRILVEAEDSHEPTRTSDPILQPATAVQPALPVSLDYYQDMIEKFRSPKRSLGPNDTVLYAQGVFDLFHSGHVGFLKKCKRNHDNDDGAPPYMVVGVHTDDKTYRLYGRFPITNMYERALALLSCKYVDKVVLGVPFDITEDFLHRMKVDYVYHGRLWNLPSDPYTVAKEKTIFHRVDSGRDTTADSIIQKVLQRKEIYLKRNSLKSESRLSKTTLVKSNV